MEKSAIFPGSSAAEQRPVKAMVVGSNPTRGAMLLEGLLVYGLLLLVAGVSTPLILLFLGLDDFSHISNIFGNPSDTKVLRVKKYFLDKVGFNYQLYFSIFVFAIYGLLDYWNEWSKLIPSFSGLGFIQGSQDLVLYFTLLIVLIYTIETYRLRDITYFATEEARKDNELRLRPYLSFHWISSLKGGSQRRGYIVDSCLVARNDGEGLMRKVSYTIEVNGRPIVVRGHNTIRKGGDGTSLVYGLVKEDNLLGDRNDSSEDGAKKERHNNELISRIIYSLKVFGEYEDLNGRTYEYSFVRDENEQAWFREEYQKRKNNK